MVAYSLGQRCQAAGSFREGGQTLLLRSFAMMVPAAGLPEIVALFHLHTLQAVPLSDGGPVWVATMDLGETGALAVALRIYAQQAGNAAARSGSRKNPYFVAISQEDQYDRTL